MGPGTLVQIMLTSVFDAVTPASACAGTGTPAARRMISSMAPAWLPFFSPSVCSRTLWRRAAASASPMGSVVNMAEMRVPPARCAELPDLDEGHLAEGGAPLGADRRCAEVHAGRRPREPGHGGAERARRGGPLLEGG